MNARILGRPRVPNLCGEIVVTADEHWFDLWRELAARLACRSMQALGELRFVQATKLGRRKESARARALAAMARMMKSEGA